MTPGRTVMDTVRGVVTMIDGSDAVTALSFAGEASP
jgi:hypothetical protein